MQPREYALAVLESLRIHFFALPATAVLAGAASTGSTEIRLPVLLAAIGAAFGWGGGQLLNDLLDVKADSIDAPTRPAPRGLLPAKPTLLIVTLIAVFVAGVTCWVHEAGIALAVLAALLLVVYGPCKRWPGLGNLAHGALMAVAVFIGAAAARPDDPLSVIVRASSETAALAGSWAAIYLQANYEKDRRGDAAARVVTLPHLIGLRASAGARAVLATLWGGAVWHMAEGASPFATGGAVALVGISAAITFQGNSEAAALRGYRYAVHGTAVGFLALARPVLPTPAFVGLMLLAGGLVELAFWRHPNP